jgi:EpsI family protein
MIRRRDMVLGGLGLAALATAEALRPRHRLVLLKSGSLDKSIPRAFGHWESESADLVSPEQAGRLAKTLYSEVVQRSYYDELTKASVMMLIAYGDTQSDLLQLHRPESCYPAVGFSLALSEPARVQISPQGVIPGRRVIATIQDRRENILYWTRLGERLPQSGGDQRTARLENAMEGYVADGALVRISTVGDSEPSFAVLRRFVPELLAAIPRDKLPALIGTRLSRTVV